MATYIIGDVQGCAAPLQALLDTLAFDPACDRAWFAGDLVNRGPDSLAVLRLVRGLGAAAVAVLGNHDLHLLARAEGCAQPGKRDTLDDVLRAPDHDELLAWLRQRPLLHYDPDIGCAMVHAGLLPQWSLAQALRLAAEAQQALAAPDRRGFFANLYGDLPDRWHEGLRGADRLRVIVNAMTRLRYCTADGIMDLQQKGPPGAQAAHLLPWYEVPGCHWRDAVIAFGHWSTLPTRDYGAAIALDSGCVWGQRLTAVHFEERRFISVPCGRT